MDTLVAIETRRATRRFDPNHVIGEADIERLMSLASRAPSAFNLQHWRFVLVRDRAQREAIRALAWMQPQITEASLLVVICADVKAWSRAPERHWRGVPADVREGILAAIDTHYDGYEQRQRDEAMRSCGIAAQTLMLAATAMGYDSCPMDLADMTAVGELVALPVGHVAAMFVAIGKGLGEAGARTARLPLDEVMVTDRFAR